MPLLCCTTFSLIVSLSILFLGSGTSPAGAAYLQRQPAASAPPPAATLLARQLGLHTRAYIGDQPRGMGRPWTIWFPRVITPGSVGPGNVPRHYLTARGLALFTGPRGAHGEFHYFALTPVSTDQVNDPYRGSPLTRARAIRIALQWLQSAGVAVPRAGMHATVRAGTTDIGGTGLCCFKSLAIVYWGAGSDLGTFGAPPKYDVYVADAGTVVQVDMGGEPAAELPAHPCPGDRSDGNGVSLGPWCFSYHAAAGGIIFSEVSFHDGWIHDPDMLASLPLSPILSHLRHAGPLQRLSLTAKRSVYQQTVKGTTYQMTLVPAFPGLVGSTWETTFVRAVHTTKTARATTSVAARLWPDGIGTVRFGLPKGRAVASLSALLGAPAAQGVNTGCTPRYTEVEWGDLVAEFRSKTFSGYRYLEGGYPLTTPGSPRASPPKAVFPRLATSRGITLGSTLAQLRRIYRALHSAGTDKWQSGNGLVFVDNANHDPESPSSRIIEIKIGTCGDF